METKIICMRHSLYVENGNISELGAALAYTMGKHLAENNPVDVILTSPKLRARQTAEILKIAMAFNGEIFPDEELDEYKDFMCFISGLQEKIRSTNWKNILIVSHGPNLEHNLDYCGYYIQSVSEKNTYKTEYVFPERPTITRGEECCELSFKLPPDFAGMMETLKKLPN